MYVLFILCFLKVTLLHMGYVDDNVKGSKPHRGLGTVVGKSCVSGQEKSHL